MDKAQILAALERQREYFSQGNTRALDFRIQQLKILRQAIIGNEDRILQALKADMGRPEVESYLSEVVYLIDETNHTLKHIRSWARVRKVKTPLLYFKASSHIYPEPLGVVLIISAWNYPFMQLFGPLAGAIAAGNCAVLKPSPVSAQCQRTACEIVKENFDPAYVTLLEGGVEVVQDLLAEKFDHIMLTGSPATGKVVMEAAAKHLTPVTLELGGKSPTIVDEDADLGRAARRVAWGKLFNAGQTCVAPDHLYVHQSVKSEFLRLMRQYIEEFYGEDPSRSPDYGRIINERHYSRLVGYLPEGSAIGEGGGQPEERYLPPAFLEDLEPTHQAMQEEIFGPILPIIEFDDLNQVLAEINRNPKPLSLYYFSNDRHKQEKVIRNTSSGGVTINDTMLHGGTMELPFGGVGNSGMGAYHGKVTFDAFTHYKSVMKRSTRFDPKLRYAPYDGKLPTWRRLVKLLGYYGRRF